ncbi:hypothetical protein EV384_4890 [Micromonospora kangleipakensis]|uniref:Uncharacterized protein n=1 Tax=Micromonospora kangleipakensis TaxID=1077942 RepID=A0A4Q8BE92_9ACTN|nr:hypothetical protein [Micromonospora kangleipakensis]RZU76254.1 hypothetical protein EV384_4890 [Micromonospora kangleipakensis]
MTRRGERLTRVALRLGLLLAGVSGAWTAYDAVTGDAAYAAEPTPTVTVIGTVDLLQGLLTDGLPATPTADPSGTAAPSTETGEATPDTPPPAASTQPTSPPPAPPQRTTGDAPPQRTARDIPPHRTAWHTPPHRTARDTAPYRRPAAAPARPGPTSHRATKSPPPTGGPSRARPAKPAATAPRPVTAKVVKPGLRPRKPVRGSAKPPAGPPDQAGAPAENAPPPGRAAPAATTPEHADRTPGADVAPSRPDAAVRQWSPLEADTPLGRLAHPLRSDADYLPPGPGPVPVPSSAGSSGAAHSDVAEGSAAAWTPPAVRGQRCRPDHPAGLSSRSPRPGTRPA